MGHYIKYNKNYWDRKIFDENSKFDTELLKYQTIEKILASYRNV